MNMSIFSRRSIAGLLAISFCCTFLSSEAKAVTYGSTVADPTISAPWVVSIWNSPTNDAKDAEFICSGTLISPHAVLTAAHCTLQPGAYFVKVKSQALRDQTEFTTVSGVWTSPRYNPKNFINDIGLLKLDEEFPGITYPSLANEQAAKSISLKSNFTLYGWGRDQSGNLADLLRSAKLSLQDNLAAKSFKSMFNPKTMISAGRKIPTENVWSGACPGDSGGPLIISINQINIVAGVTSFGEKSCLTPNPTVFSRVSYYYSDIKDGLKAVELKSNVVNRAAPIATSDPQIMGNIATNSSLTCNPGQWKNSVSTSISWTMPKRLAGTTTPTIRVLTSDAGQIFSCTVIISTQSGTIVRKVLTKQSASAPILTAQPAISGVDLSAPATAGSTLRCDNWNWDGPVDTESIQWFLTAQANPPAPVNGQLIGNSRTLFLDLDLISQLKGRYVTCNITGTRNGFSVDAVTSIKLNPLDGPTISSVNVSGLSQSLGSSLTCLFSASQSATKIDIAWGTSPDGINFSPFPGITGNVLQINKSVLQQGAGKIVACQVKVTNNAGQAQRIGVSSTPFPFPPAAPTVSIGNPGTITASSYLTCSAQAGSGYYGQLSYQWGITSASNSTNFLGGVLSTSYSLNMNSTSFAQAAGNYVTCVATATNDAGNSSGAASVYVAPIVLPLPALSRPTLMGETTQTNTLTESIGISAISGFDSAKMSLSLTLTPSTGSCSSPIQISSTPTTVNCSGLSPSSNYSAQLTVSYLTGGNGLSQTSSPLSFTTAAIQTSLYVCATTCTGSLTNAQLLAEISDQRTIEAKSLTTVTVNGAQTGAPITHSTCVGAGCSPGTAPSLPVSCGNAGVETTEVISNVSAQITTAFRYCKPNAVDTIAPTITNNALSMTGYAPIIPTSGAPATSIQVRFGAADTVGIASTSVRLVNPSSVVVSTVPGTFLVGSVTSGVYQAYVATALSGPVTGDVYQIQAQASDAAGNGSAWFTIGSFTVQQTSLKPLFGNVTSNASGFTVQISNYDSNFTWTSSVTGGATSSISSSGLVTVSSVVSGGASTLTVTTSRSGYASANSTVSGTTSTPALPVFGVAAISSITANSVTVTQPVKPNGWDSNWQLIAQVFSNDQLTLLGAASPGSYYTPGAALVVTANNVGGIAPDTNYQVRFAIYDNSLNRYSYGPFTLFRTSALVVADTQAPVVDLSNVTVSPTSLYENGTISIVAPITDNVGVTSVIVAIGQLSFALTKTAGTLSSGVWSGSSGMNFKGGASDGYLQPGLYSPVITASDSSGNSSSVTKTAAFILGSQAGGATIASASAASISGTLYPGGTVQINANIIAYNQIISAVRFSSDGSNLNKTGVLTEVSGNSYNKNFSTTFLLASNQTPGTFTINLVAETANGRSSTTFPISIAVIPTPAPVSKAQVTDTYFTGSVQNRCTPPDCQTVRASWGAVYWEAFTMNAKNLSLTATNGTTTYIAPDRNLGGPSPESSQTQQAFDYGNGMKKWGAFINISPGTPPGAYVATWIATDDLGVVARFSAGTFTVLG